MKAKIIVSISILIPFTLVLIYMWSTATDLVYREDLVLIKGGFIENYLNGHLTFSDLWKPGIATRLLGYNLLQIINIKYFSMNSKCIVLLIPLLMMTSALLVYYDFRKSLIDKLTPNFIDASYIILSFIIFNVIQWESLTFSYGFVFQSPMPFFIASFISLELFLLKNNLRYWFAAYIFIILAVLVFGGTHNFAFIPALVSTYFCYFFVNHSNLQKYFVFKITITTIFFLFVFFLYMFRITENDYFKYSSYLHHMAVSAVLADPLGAVKFLLASFGSSVLGMDAFFTYDFLSYNNLVIFGLVIFSFYVLAIVLFFRSHMFQKTYLPLFLIMMTVWYLSLMTIARFIWGTHFVTVSHYSCVSIFGLVALVWIFIFNLASNLKLNSFLKGLILTGFTVIITGLTLTSITTWDTQPERKAYFEQLRDIALRVDTASPEELFLFSEKPENVRASLCLLREHKLNVYRH